MKLFQQMLVAGASLSLLAPVASQASDVVNIEEMNSYARSQAKSSRLDSKTFINEVSEDIANLKSRVDGLEVKQNEFEAGGFSDTTTLDGKVNFTVGALSYDGSGTDTVSNEAALFQYMWQGNLNTSFTGDDNLYVRLKTGNASSWTKDKDHGTYLSSAKGNSNVLKVDKIWYQFPVGEQNTVFVGPLIENYYMHGTTPSIYKPVLKAFTLGGNAAAYGASTDTGAGWVYKADNGFAISSNVGTKSHSTQKNADGDYIESGLFTDQSKTSWANQIGITKDQWAVSAMVNLKYNDWGDSYFSTATGDDRNENSTNYGLRAWWRPADSGTATPEVSVGYDYSVLDGYDSNDTTDAFFVGLTWLDTFNAEDRLGVAFGQPQMRENTGAEPFMYEVYYGFKVNDSVTVTPAIFGATNANGTDGEDYTGAVIETQFKF
ncbi:MAG: carbohydrate porin [Prochlorococcus marinus CUG1436]|nr:carbohydrate porin [Prochlorococcus marinus CUG1436]